MVTNLVWLPPASTPVKQKRRRSPDAPSAPVKQKRHRSTNELPASPSTSLGAGAVKARSTFSNLSNIFSLITGPCSCRQDEDVETETQACRSRPGKGLTCAAHPNGCRRLR